MTSCPPDPGTAPALLLVVAHGIGANALTALRSHAALPCHAVHLGPSGEGATSLLTGEADASSLLHELGVTVDRSSLVLRSATTCDDSAIAALSRRPTGPGQATILELHQVAEAGVTAGPGAVPTALSQLAQHIAAAAARVRSGAPTEVWLLGLGDLQPVVTTFDFARAFRASRAAPIGDQLELRVGLGCVTIRAGNQRARDIARGVLAGETFRQHGSVANTFGHQLRFLAASNVAFGTRRVAARPPNREEADLQALLPRAPRASEIALDLRSLIARFWLRAAAHVDLRMATAAPATTAPASVDDAVSLVHQSLVHESLVHDASPPAATEVDSALRRS